MLDALIEGTEVDMPQAGLRPCALVQSQRLASLHAASLCSLTILLKHVSHAVCTHLNWKWRAAFTADSPACFDGQASHA